MTIQPSVWIRTLCRKNGRAITDYQIVLLERYVSLLLDWNAKINLISRRDAANVWESHIAHSISPLFKIDLPEGATVLDLGSGGGLPGIPWKILLPSISLTMLDSTQKKISAVQSMVTDLGLSGATAVWGRAEDLESLPQYHRKFDYVVARAVGPLDELAKLARPFLTSKASGPLPDKRFDPSPALLAFKGGEIGEELNRTKRVKGVESIETLLLFFDGADQTALTDKKFAIVKFSKDET